MKSWAVVALLIVLGIPAGCTSTGPDVLSLEHGLYNNALHQSRSEQLLLNIVRLHYRELPQFLTVSAINSRFEFERQAGAVTQLESGMSTPVDIAGRLTWSENPTITYVPLRGQSFVTEVLSPVTPATLALIANSGWAVDRLFRLSVQRLGGLPNAPSASGPTPFSVPEYAQFLDTIRRLRELQRGDALYLRAATTDDGESVMVMQVTPAGLGTDQYAAIAEVLGPADPSGRWLLAGPGVMPEQAHRVQIETRSFLSMLYYLGHGVHAPRNHIERGLVTQTSDNEGNPFDWQLLMGGLFEVNSSSARPRDADVAVSYRGTWFSIHEADLESKTSFALAQIMLALKSGELKEAGPALTLSVD